MGMNWCRFLSEAKHPGKKRNAETNEVSLADVLFGTNGSLAEALFGAPVAEFAAPVSALA